ncbi:MAG: cache domain-containing protein [Dissulfurispiraceae bacterium]
MGRIAKISVIMAVLISLMVAFASVSFADDKEMAVALVKKAVAYYKANGMDKALDEFMKPGGQFVQGDLYIFVYDLKGTMLAHPNRALVGQNLIDKPDSKGKMFRKDIIDIAKTAGSGWVDYVYTNPKTLEDEAKTTYFEKIEDLVICCGIYKK